MNTQKIDHERFKLVVFAIYTVIYEGIIWGIFSYAIFMIGESGWWMILAVVMSSSQLKPKHFGLPYKIKDKYDKERQSKKTNQRL